MSEAIFYQTIAQQKVTCYDGNTWQYVDYGKNEKNPIPLVCLPGTTATPSVFHQQLLSLGKNGYRVIAIQHPVVWTPLQWVHSFDRFLDALKISKVHLYGVSLGGYLAQLYAAQFPARVQSLALTNSFCTTDLFRQNSPSPKLLPYLPDFYLKKYVLDHFPKRFDDRLENDLQAIDYMVDQLELLSQAQLASRLVLNCLAAPASMEHWHAKVNQRCMTLIDSYGSDSLPPKLRTQVYEQYPLAKKAFLKTLCDFPYLSIPEEVTLHLQIHLRSNAA